MNFLLLLLPTLVVAPWYNDQVIKVGTDCKAKGWNTVLSFCTEFGEPGYPHTYWICIIHENTLHGKATFQLRSCGTSYVLIQFIAPLHAWLIQLISGQLPGFIGNPPSSLCVSVLRIQNSGNTQTDIEMASGMGLLN